MTNCNTVVPFFSSRIMLDELRPALERALARVIDSGQSILGDELSAFERQFATYCGVSHAIGVASGLDALALILRALGIDRESEVIVPGQTFVATWLAADQVGARLVPVDIDPVTFNIDHRAVKSAITKRTRAIIAVHLYGQPAEMHELSSLARQFNIDLIEDAAQAHGAMYYGRRAGGLGKAAAFSFYPTKNLGALGDGGAVTTDDPELAERIRGLRNYGSTKKYHHEVPGVNSRLDELQAAFLSARLPHLDAKNGRRREIANAYSGHLRDLPELKVPTVPDGTEPVWHLYVVRSRVRDTLRARLDEEGIGTLIHYPIPPHLQKVYAGTYLQAATLPHTELAASEVLSLPMWPEMSDAEVSRVACSVRKAAVALG